MALLKEFGDSGANLAFILFDHRATNLAYLCHLGDLKIDYILYFSYKPKKPLLLNLPKIPTFVLTNVSVQITLKEKSTQGFYLSFHF